MKFKKLISLSGMLLIGMMFAVNSWAGNAKQCGYLYNNHDYHKAFSLCLKAAMQDDLRAQFYLASMYSKGQGVAQSNSEAIIWFHKVAARGVASAQHNLGLMYYKQKNYSEAVKWYHKAALQGLSNAQFYLGLMYENGRGVKQSYTMAVKWYTKAAEQSHISAQFNLATMYDNGRGVKQNYALAAKWYRKAANQGRANAQFNLGAMYAKGQGVKLDYTKALKWYHTAAKQGLAEAQFNLGVMYDNGQGVLRSPTAADDWYYKAGLSYLNQEKRDEALTCVERIKKQGNIANAFLGDKLLAQIYGGREKTKKSPKTKRQNIFTGTGWPVAAGYIVTNHHVIAGYHTITLVRKDGVQIKATVVADDTANDLALLKPESLKNIPPALPMMSQPVQVGTPVFTVGYPHPDLMGVEPKLTQGIVNAMTGIANDPRTYQISVPLQGGNSGGPLINMRGEVLGVVASKLSAAKVLKWTGDLPQNVNYAIKSEYVLTLLSSIDSSNNIPVLPAIKATLPELAKRIEGSVLMIIVK